MKFTFYWTVYKEDNTIVRAGKTDCTFTEDNYTDKAVKEARKAAELYVANTGEAVRFTVGGAKTPYAKEYRQFMKNVNYILNDRIKKPVSDMVKQVTAECMNKYNMGLYDSFKCAAGECAKRGTKLYKAWYTDDFREYIPDAYIKEYLDFTNYPLKY